MARIACKPINYGAKLNTAQEDLMGVEARTLREEHH